MALSTNTYTYTGGAQTFAVNFALGFIQRSDVSVRVNNAIDGSGDPAYASIEWIDDSALLVLDVLTIGDTVEVLRTVSKSELKVNFTAGADITPSNLDLSSLQGLMVYQELVDGRVEGTESPLISAARAETAAIAAEASEVSAAADAVLTAADVVTSAAATAAAAASAAAALVSENAAAADLILTNADAASTAADLVQTNIDQLAVAADAAQVAVDKAAVAADLLLTDADTIATAADRAAVAADLLLTDADTIATAADRAAVAADLLLTDADTVATAADRVQTGLDATATAADLVQTNLDTIATAADRVVTTQDAIDTAADVVLTNADVISSAANAAAAAASYDSFDDRYLGNKASEPALDNDGNALLTGALYWNTTTSRLYVWGGSVWNQGAFDSTGLLVSINNLSDLDNITTARTNLGLGTAATTASTAYATAAQGSLADSAVQPNDNISTLINDAGYTGNSIPLGAIIPIRSGLTGVYATPASGVVDANGFMYCDGSVIPGGNAVSGSTPNLTDGRFLRGSTSSGTTGGSATFTLTTGNLPSHTHTGTTVSNGAHAHTASSGTAGSHDHTGSADSAGAHTHAVDQDNGTQTIPNNSSVNRRMSASSTGSAGAHTHTLTIAAGGDHSHSVTVDSGGDHSHTFTTDATGSGTAVSHIPLYFNVVYLMRVN